MLQITIWDVNHGSAAYIRTPNSRHIAVDLGADGDNFSPLQTLRGRGVVQLDAVVLTHPHRDHLDDIFSFSQLSPASLWTPRHLTETDIRAGNRIQDVAVVNRYLQLRQQYTAPLPPGVNLTVPNNFGGAALQIFAPFFCDPANLNNHSLVVVVGYAGLKMVIPGDNESPSWKELLNDLAFAAAVKGADVLLASHHGREAGYCGELFDAMGKPKLVIVSDGRFRDTSATDRYSKQATGWLVHDGNGLSETRKCVTTRSDGHITISFDWSADPRYINSLHVKTSKTNLDALVAKYLGF